MLETKMSKYWKLKCLNIKNWKLKCLNIENLQKFKNPQGIHQIQASDITISQPIVV
jgi:hypothetical protein